MRSFLPSMLPAFALLAACSGTGDDQGESGRVAWNCARVDVPLGQASECTATVSSALYTAATSSDGVAPSVFDVNTNYAVYTWDCGPGVVSPLCPGADSTTDASGAAGASTGSGSGGTGSTGGIAVGVAYGGGAGASEGTSGGTGGTGGTAGTGGATGTGGTAGSGGTGAEGPIGVGYASNGGLASECAYGPDLTYCGGAAASGGSAAGSGSGSGNGNGNGNGAVNGNGGANGSGGANGNGKGNGASSEGSPGANSAGSGGGGGASGGGYGGGSGGGDGGSGYTCVGEKSGEVKCRSKKPSSCVKGAKAAECGACVPEGETGGDCAPPGTGGCWITGGGFVSVTTGGNGKATFGGNGKPMKDGRIQGEWNHVDHGTGGHIHGEVRYLVCRHVDEPGPGHPSGPKKDFKDNQAYFGGPARFAETGPLAEGYWFDVFVEDHGEPGNTSSQGHRPGTAPDEYRITLRKQVDPANQQSGTILYSAGLGQLGGGNIQLHPPNGGHPATASSLPKWVSFEN